MFGPPEVPEPVNAQVSQFAALGKPVEDKTARRPGDDDLATVRDLA